MIDGAASSLLQVEGPYVSRREQNCPHYFLQGGPNSPRSRRGSSKANALRAPLFHSIINQSVDNELQTKAAYRTDLPSSLSLPGKTRRAAGLSETVPRSVRTSRRPS